MAQLTGTCRWCNIEKCINMFKTTDNLSSTSRCINLWSQVTMATTREAGVIASKDQCTWTYNRKRLTIITSPKLIEIRLTIILEAQSTMLEAPLWHKDQQWQLVLRLTARSSIELRRSLIKTCLRFKRRVNRCADRWVKPETWELK